MVQNVKKSSTRTLAYQGERYVPVPAVVTYRGAKYVLATDTGKRDKPKNVEVDVPSIVYALNLYPKIRTVIDSLDKLAAQLSRTTSNLSGKPDKPSFRWITDSGASKKYQAIMADPDTYVEALDDTIDNFAKIDAISEVLTVFVDTIRKEVFKDQLMSEYSRSGTYTNTYNSQLNALQHILGSVSVIADAKNAARITRNFVKKEMKELSKGKMLLEQGDESKPAPQKQEQDA